VQSTGAGAWAAGYAAFPAWRRLPWSFGGSVWRERSRVSCRGAAAPSVSKAHRGGLFWVQACCQSDRPLSGLASAGPVGAMPDPRSWRQAFTRLSCCLPFAHMRSSSRFRDWRKAMPGSEGCASAVRVGASGKGSRSATAAKVNSRGRPSPREAAWDAFAPARVAPPPWVSPTAVDVGPLRGLRFPSQWRPTLVFRLSPAVFRRRIAP
jgi:hypothetical protein